MKIKTSKQLADVRYEIRGDLARRARDLERRGFEIVHLNVGNPGRFGFRTPETMRLAMIENLSRSEAYCHQKGIFPAREAVVMQQQSRGVEIADADDVFIGNGVSELIDMVLRALLDAGDEVLIPAPDYPLWTAATVLNGGKAVHYPCPPEAGFQPDLEALEAAITPRTRALVVINPNNPTGAVYGRKTLEEMARIAERHRLVLLSDEIYDQVLFDEASFCPMATLVHETLCVTLSGLSKVYRACGYRVGWAVFTGEKSEAREYLLAVEKLAALRLCSNVPAQWAVQTALGGVQSIRELVNPGGRLYESRSAVLEAVAASKHLDLVRPMGAMYAFPGVRGDHFDQFDDEAFASELLERFHILLVPGNSFNVDYRTHFRITLLPDDRVLRDVFEKIEELLCEMAEASVLA
ncbi:MAG: aminotransferase class I/II-fold pyridoxal phosphate-dependent enzyme [Xanthomonadales bacterium]|nr:aminotransferase class I/II-fold pyridoxal phosphate-dependent enzyme [Xanthomonadales bacterium]